MNQHQPNPSTHTYEEVNQATVNRTLSQTWKLLSMTLFFAAAMAMLALETGVFFGPLITLGVYFVLLFVVARTEDRAIGLFWVFMLTGWLGFSLGPLLSYVLALNGGSDTVLTALAGTGGIFLLTSAFGRNPERDLSSMGPFLMVGVLVAFVTGLVNVFFLEIPALQSAIAAAFMLLSSGIIAWYTNVIVRGGETNYIRATVMLFVAVYNLFTSLLMLLGFNSDD
ncbi:MAG: Bax inhibitor-1 family protein [Gammaproteobacteria bacterium AqS3]|nr:Bax inhibitor-1 family protein [Gammaproteobacteria bacterium AqS3]